MTFVDRRQLVIRQKIRSKRIGNRFGTTPPGHGHQHLQGPGQNLSRPDGLTCPGDPHTINSKGRNREARNDWRKR